MVLMEIGACELDAHLRSLIGSRKVSFTLLSY